jgi:hypothetical protein
MRNCVTQVKKQGVRMKSNNRRHKIKLFCLMDQRAHAQEPDRPTLPCIYGRNFVG